MDFYQQDFEREKEKEGTIQKEVRRGEVFWSRTVETDSAGDPFMGKIRPVVVVSNEKANQYSNYITVVPVTSKEKKPLPTHVNIHVNMIEGTAVCENIIAINKQWLESFCGELNETTMRELDNALRLQLALDERKQKNVTQVQGVADVFKDEENHLHRRIITPEFVALEKERDIYKQLYNEFFVKTYGCKS